MLNEKAVNKVEEIQKSQAIRLVDVFFIAPYLIYVSTKSKITELDKYLLLGLGVATLVYNGFNYYENIKDKKDE